MWHVHVKVWKKLNAAVDDIYTKRKRDETNKLLYFSFKYKVIVKENPEKLLDSKITRENNEINHNCFSKGQNI